MTAPAATAERTAPVIDAAPASPNIVPRQPPGAALAAALAAGKTELVKALAKAILDCKAAPKDAYNGFHKYWYASAEAIIGEGRAALAANGLVPIPLDSTLEPTDRAGDERWELHRTILLSHTSGECVMVRVIWPVIPQAGRPLDKALASADTISLSYWLRDILMMPRVDPADDVAGRADGPAGPAKQAKPKKAPAPDPRDGLELEAMIQKGDRRYADKGLFPAGALIAHMQSWGRARTWGDDMARWPADGIKAAMDEAAAFRRSCETKGKPAGPAPARPDAAEVVGARDLDALYSLMRRKGVEWGMVQNIGASVGVAEGAAPADLTREQYARVVAILEREPDVAPAKK